MADGQLDLTNPDRQSYRQFPEGDGRVRFEYISPLTGDSIVGWRHKDGSVTYSPEVTARWEAARRASEINAQQPQQAPAQQPAMQSAPVQQGTGLPAAIPQPQQSAPVGVSASQSVSVQKQPDPWASFPDAPKQADPWAKFPDAAPAERSWADVPGEALENLPSSAANFAKSIVHPFLHPVDTVTSLIDVGSGVASKAFRAVGIPQNPEKTAEIEKSADAVGAFFKDRYGTSKGFKNALATDPVGTAGDLALALMTGGGAMARAPGLIGKAGAGIQKAGSAIDPLNNAARAVKGAGSATNALLGTMTGVGERPLREAFKAGQTGNQAFVDSMRGAAPIDNVVDMAEDAVSKMGRDRSAAYTANMAPVQASQAQISLLPVQKAIADAADMVMYKGVTKNADAADIITQMEKKYVDFLNLSPTDQTAQALDALKQSVNEIRLTTKQGTLSNKVANKVYHSIGDEIRKQVPEYAKAMKDYSAASDNINEMRRTLSVNDKATTDTTLRKLQSTMRNNVNANYGQRERLLDELARYQPDLPGALAGQALNTVAPRGLARINPGAAIAAGGATMNPATLATLPFMSPRLMGEAAYATGQAADLMAMPFERYGITPAMVANAMRIAYGSGSPDRAIKEDELNALIALTRQGAQPAQ